MSYVKFIIISLLLLSCSHDSRKNNKISKIKNIILIIGDGMGPQQLELLQLYAKFARSSKFKDGITHFEKMTKDGEVGIVEVNPEHSLVTDSSCSATQYATGEYSLPETVGVDSKGKAVKTIIDIAKGLGKSTGLITDTRLTHATPASFIAHTSKRKFENEIAEQFIANGADVMLGGGLRHFLPKNIESLQEVKKMIPSHISKRSKRKDNRNLLTEAKQAGYELVFSKDALKKNKSKKILGLFKSSGLPDGIEYRENLVPNVPSLKEMTEAGIKQLAKNPNGFFLMVEAGQIDWAGHQNDAGLMLAEMKKMDEMLGSVLKWAKGRDDTLVILTADHETGSFGFSYNALSKGRSYPMDKKLFMNGIYKPNFNYGNPDVLDRLNLQTRSFVSLYYQFQKLPKKMKTAQFMMDLINQNSDFKVDLAGAKRILKTKVNPHYEKNHPTFYHKVIPAINDFAPFYPVPNNSFASLIGRELSTEQHTVWGSGSHTSTPVILVAYGPKSVIRQFDGLHHSTEIGKLLQKILKN